MENVYKNVPSGTYLSAAIALPVSAPVPHAGIHLSNAVHAEVAMSLQKLINVLEHALRDGIWCQIAQCQLAIDVLPIVPHALRDCNV